MKSPYVRQHGFTLLELVIVIGLIGFLGAVALDKLLALQVDAERVSMERQLAALRSAAGLVLAEHVVEGRIEELPSLDGRNPVQLLLREAPANYAGTFAGDDPPVTPGQWYFDRTRGELVYRARSVDYFRGSGVRADEARFRLALVYQDVNGDEDFTQGADKIRGLQIRSVGSYSWLNEPVVGGLQGSGGYGPRGL